MSGQSATSTLIEQLAACVERPVGPADRTRASLHLIDWLACAGHSKETTLGRRFALLAGGDAGGRAFAWGALGNVLEMDDVDRQARLHCGPVIVPAALALAGPDDGRRLLDAMVRGYEATIRLGRAVGNGHYALWHSTATCGPIGAAASAADLLGLEREARAHAMALAVSQAAGFWQTRHEPESDGKQLHTAHAARAGVDAARLAEAGVTGPLSILEGPQGFFAATCPDGRPGDVVADPDARWRMHETSFKPWPACRHAHAAIDAALKARNHWQGEPVDVVTYGDAIAFCDRPAPNTEIEAKFSLQHSVAVSLLRGAPGLEDFRGAALDDPQITMLRSKIRVRSGQPFASAYPARYGAALSFGDQRFDVPDALGDPENPLTEEEVEDKLKTLWADAGRPGAGAVIAACHDLAEGGSLAPILEAMA